MYRYELKCYMCKTTIGYMSSPYNDDSKKYILNSVCCGEVKEPICCPICEVRRLKAKENK